MQNKLQELTDKLYNEGLSKGKKEAEDLKAAAVKESDRIIADARKEAEKIVADARKPGSRTTSGWHHRRPSPLSVSVSRTSL